MMELELKSMKGSLGLQMEIPENGKSSQKRSVSATGSAETMKPADKLAGSKIAGLKV
jgi:hypothetical protein